MPAAGRLLVAASTARQGAGTTRGERVGRGSKLALEQRDEVGGLRADLPSGRFVVVLDVSP